jgi:hypothetical protein
MPDPKPAPPWLTCSLNCLTAILVAVFGAASPLAADLARMEPSHVVGGDELGTIRSSDPPPGQLLATGLAEYAAFTLAGNGTSPHVPQCSAYHPHYSSGYSCAAAFLTYLEELYGRTIITNLHAHLSSGTYSDSL